MDQSQSLWTNGGWKNYDVIMGNTALTHYPEGLNLMATLPQEALNKMLIGVWANVGTDNNHFAETIKYTKGPLFHCVTSKIKNGLKNIYDIDASLLKAGIDTNKFKPFKEVTQIKTIGLNGHPSIGAAWCEVKRPELLKDIAIKSNCDGLFIFNSKDEGSSIYKDIDMYVCTSVHESGPGGILECALSKIPVLSTKTGYGVNLKSIKTFETADEAATIINELNASPQLLNDYIEEVYAEVIHEYDWNNLAINAWVPLIEKRLGS